MADIGLSGGIRNPVDESRSVAEAGRSRAPVMLILFMATVILPVSFTAAGVSVSPIRILLLIAFIPVVVRILAGQAGPVRLADILMLLFGGWVAMTIVMAEGTERLPYGAMLGVELTGGYFIGRLFVRSAADWRLMVYLHLFALLVMAPFAAIELFSGRQIWAEVLDPLGDVKYRAHSSRPRFGLERVLTGFEHPILYGLFCSLAAAGVIAIWGKTILRALFGLGFVTGMTFASLSSGPFLAVMIQIGLVVWGWMTKGRWWLLAILGVSIFVFLSLASNRGPVVIFIETLTFNSGTGWTRIVQWEYGWASVVQNPIFGIGLGTWDRPRWLGASIDSFWLVIALRHGLLGLVIMLAALGLIFASAVRAKNLTPTATAYRLAWAIGTTGLFFTLTTVHIWNAISVFAMFYIGAGSWLSEAGAKAEEKDPDTGENAEETAQTAGRTRPSYRRDFGAPAPSRQRP